MEMLKKKNAEKSLFLPLKKVPSKDYRIQKNTFFFFLSPNFGVIVEQQLRTQVIRSISSLENK